MALIDLLGKIETLKKELDGLKPVSPEREKLLWEKFRLEWNFNSNHIEGNTLTYSETQLFFLHDKTTGDHDMREYEEMRAHDAAIHLISNWAEEKDREISEAEIRELNKVILVKPFWKEAITPDGQKTRRLIKVGEYKEHPNSVMLSTGKMFEYASPEETPRLMAELVAWYRASEIKNAIILAAELHYRYIRIHPFDDGNGRIARLLVNYVLMKNDFPPVIIKSAEKEKYLTALRKADAGDREAFHEYMAEQLIWSLEIAVKAAKGESIEEPEDIDKKIKLLEQRISVIDPEKQIKVQLNKTQYLSIANSWVRDLALVWAKSVKKFSSFFKEQKFTIIFSGLSEPYSIDINKNTTDQNLSKRFDLLKFPPKITFDKTNASIQLHASYKMFQKAGINTFDCNNSILIQFSETKYQIISTKFLPNGTGTNIILFEKLLHQNLNNDEQNEIVSVFSYSMLNEIEFQMQARKII